MPWFIPVAIAIITTIVGRPGPNYAPPEPPEPILPTPVLPQGSLNTVESELGKRVAKRRGRASTMLAHSEAFFEEEETLGSDVLGGG